MPTTCAPSTEWCSPLVRQRARGHRPVHALGGFGFPQRQPSLRRALAPAEDRCGSRHPGPPAERCETLSFANVWERTPQGLRLLRVVSFDH